MLTSFLRTLERPSAVATWRTRPSQTESAPGALWRSGGSFRRARLPKQRPLAADQTILVATHLAAAAAVFRRSQKRRAVISDTLLAGAPPRLLGNVAAAAKGLNSGFNKVSETS